MAVSFETLGAQTGSSDGLTITPGNNVKGSYFELIASSGLTAKLFYLICSFNNGSNNDPCISIDIATGAASSESIIIPDILFECGRSNQSSDAAPFYGPYLLDDIASGTRFAIRCEMDGTQTFDVLAIIANQRVPDLTSPTHLSYGVTLGGTPKGTTIDPGGTSHTKGSYVELTSSFSSTGEHVWFHFGHNNNVVRTDTPVLVDIAIGSAASEVVVIDNIFLNIEGVGDSIGPPVVGPFPADIFQGERVSARAQCAITDAADRLFSMAMTATAGTVAAGGGGGGMLVHPGMGGGIRA